jgi:hypothetical protein
MTTSFHSSDFPSEWGVYDLGQGDYYERLAAVSIQVISPASGRADSF